MNVRELIDALSTFDENHNVVIISERTNRDGDHVKRDVWCVRIGPYDDPSNPTTRPVFVWIHK